LLLNGAVVLVSWYGGRGPALLALALAAGAVDYLFLPPFGFGMSAAGAMQLGVFMVEAAGLAALTIATKEARGRAEASLARGRCAEARLRKLNEAHRALSASNEALVRAEDEHVLLEEICRAVVELAGYRMCWVGWAEQDKAKSVRPVARAGYDEGYVDGVEVTWADTARGRGPAGTAIRAARPCVVQSLATDPEFAPWGVEALKRGYQSVIGLPLRADGHVFGVLGIYAAVKAAFDADAVRLLTDLSNDLAYGLSALRARATVAAERARFETTLMQVPVAVAVYAGPNHVVRLANRRWLALGLGIDSVGKPLRESLPKEGAARVLSVLDEVQASGEPRDLAEQPLVCPRPDGSVETRFFNIAYRPLTGVGGVVTDIIEATSDVTEQVAARRTMEQARAAAEQASCAKDEFLRILSHELRTPLTPLLFWAQSLKRSPRGDLESLERGLEIILSSARAEARLVDDLLDVSEMVAGRMTLSMQPIELGPIVRACVDEARPRAAAKGVALEASISAETPLVGDAGRLQQAVCNLLSNALKFTPRGGRIDVEVTRGPGSLTLRIRDTGIGISDAELGRLFAPFHTCDRSLKRSKGGLGLGLFIARYIVEAHGGTIRAESAGPHRGTTFIVELRAPATRTAA
jgi:signal transduction histidine kinase